MKLHTNRALRSLCLLLAVCLCGGSFVACATKSEIPDGYQYATCRGEYFRLFVPTQWTVNTESGVSGAYIAVLDETAVSMVEVPFEKPDVTPDEGEGETAAPDTTATLDDFVAAHIAEISTLRGYKAEKSFDTTLGAYRAKDITYAATVGGKDYRYRQVLCKVEGRFYLFTYSSRTESFEKWLDIVDGILAEVMFYGQPFEGSEDEKKIPAVEGVPAGMKLVSDNDVPYRFFAPEAWLVTPGSASSQVYVSETDRSNVTVIGYVPERDSYSVADYWADTEKYYKDALGDYTLLYCSNPTPPAVKPGESTAETVGETVEDTGADTTPAPPAETMGGNNATIYEFTYTLGGVPYKCRQAICVYSYMIVIMTYTALPENYDAHLGEVEAMQAALTFRKPIIG